MMTLIATEAPIPTATPVLPPYAPLKLNPPALAITSVLSSAFRLTDPPSAIDKVLVVGPLFSM